MSSIGDPDDPHRPHQNNYQLLKNEQSLEEIPERKPVEESQHLEQVDDAPEQKPVAAQVEPEATYMSELDKDDAAVAMRNEEVIRFNAERPRTMNEAHDFNIRMQNTPYEELVEMKAEREARAEEPKEVTDLDRAKEAALKEMEERDIPPPPPEPTRPETHGKSR